MSIYKSIPNIAQCPLACICTKLYQTWLPPSSCEIISSPNISWGGSRLMHMHIAFQFTLCLHVEIHSYWSCQFDCDVNAFWRIVVEDLVIFWKSMFKLSVRAWLLYMCTGVFTVSYNSMLSATTEKYRMPNEIITLEILSISYYCCLGYVFFLWNVPS